MTGEAVIRSSAWLECDTSELDGSATSTALALAEGPNAGTTRKYSMWTGITENPRLEDTSRVNSSHSNEKGQR